MDDSTPMRALTIGVSIFIALATITAIMIYYNTAKNAAGIIGNQAKDIATSYRQDIEDMLLSGGTITGTDVINLLNYFKNDQNVNITIKNQKYIQQPSDKGVVCTDGVCTTENSNVNNSDNFDSILKRILPNQNFEMNKVDMIGTEVKQITLTGKRLLED